MGYFLDRDFLRMYAELEGHLISQYDLFGERGNVKLLFPICSRLLKRSLSDDPNIAVPEKSIKWRKSSFSLIRKTAPLFMAHKQIIEDRNMLQNMSGNGSKKDCGISLPEKPVIYAPNHGFYDDIAATILVAKRPTYLVTDALPELFNTMAGLALWLMGIVLLNNKVKESRCSSMEKAKQVLNCGSDIILFPEGVWNKTPNLLALPLHRGIYRIAKETDADVVPVIHFVENHVRGGSDNPIHTVVDDAISFDNMDEDEALSYLRDRIAYWYFLMIEKYGSCKREDIIKPNQDSVKVWEKYVRELIGDDEFYDAQLIKRSDYRPKDVIRPEDAFKQIAEIKNITQYNASMVEYAKETVRTRKNEDFQRKF